MVALTSTKNDGWDILNHSPADTAWLLVTLPDWVEFAQIKSRTGDAFYISRTQMDGAAFDGANDTYATIPAGGTFEVPVLSRDRLEGKILGIVVSHSQGGSGGTYEIEVLGRGRAAVLRGL